MRKPKDVLSVQAQPTRTADKRGFTTKNKNSNEPIVTSLVLSTLTVAVPGEADPHVVIFGGVEVPDELHLGPAVDGHQVGPERLAVVSGVRPGVTLQAAVHGVTVAAVGDPERQTLPVAGGRSRRRFL